MLGDLSECGLSLDTESCKLNELLWVNAAGTSLGSSQTSWWLPFSEHKETRVFDIGCFQYQFKHFWREEYMTLPSTRTCFLPVSRLCKSSTFVS